MTQFQYDNLNRLTRATDPLNQVTEMTYDNSDNLLTLKDARNNVYIHGYDTMNRKISLRYPDNSAEGSTFDAAGNLATYTTRAGQVRTFSHDNRNRETGFTWSDGTPAVTKTYDVAGRILTLNNSVSALSYSYDAANQLLSETQQIAGSAGAKTVSYAYDGDGQRQSLAYPDGNVAAYAYTARDQLKTISNGGSQVVDYTYDPNGNRTAKTLGNNTTSTYSYDDANRTLSVTHSNSGGTFASFNYGYNSVGNRTHVQREDAKGDVYGYDATDQITGVQYNAADPAGAPFNPSRTVAYSHDPVGNRTGVTDNGAATSYTSNNLNQYTVIGDIAPSYDANGNLGQRRRAAYAYDSQNRLISAGSERVGSATTFAYDGRNRRVHQTVSNERSGVPVTTYFYFDGWNLLEERNSSDVQQARYLHGAAIDELLTRITPPASFFYYHDVLGNTVALSHGTGIPLERYSYAVYGAPSFKDGNGNSLTASASGNRFLFTGREYLAGLNLYDYRNRFYSPDFGRFLQTDSIRFAGGDINLYRYVRNAPTKFIDPSGKLGIVPSYIGGILTGAAVGAGTGSFFGGVGAVPGAIIGGIAAAIILAPTNANAPTPPGDDESNFDHPDPNITDRFQPDSAYNDRLLEATEECEAAWEEISADCPDLTEEDKDNFMEDCLGKKGF